MYSHLRAFVTKVGDKLPLRESSQKASTSSSQADNASTGRGIETGDENEANEESAVIMENPNDALRPPYEPMGFGPPAYLPPGVNVGPQQYAAAGSIYSGGGVGITGVPYDAALYGADYMNNAAFSGAIGGPYDNTIYGLPQDTYDEDDVFLRAGGIAPMGAYPGFYPGTLLGASMQPRLYAVPQQEGGDAMRYVQCLKDGVLAVWGDEKSPYFPQQFSKAASIYCYTDIKDKSMVISNRMIPNNVLIQTTPDTTNAPIQDSNETKENKSKQKHRKSKSSAKKAKKETIHIETEGKGNVSDQIEETNESQINATSTDSSDSKSADAIPTKEESQMSPDEQNVTSGDTSEGQTNASESNTQTSEGQTNGSEGQITEPAKNTDKNEKESGDEVNKGDIETKSDGNADQNAAGQTTEEKGQSENDPDKGLTDNDDKGQDQTETIDNVKEGRVLD